MSQAEIADNKWEVESTKPPIMTAGGIAQIVMMGGFSLFFGYVLVFSVIGAVSPKQDSALEAQYKAKLGGGEAAAAPAEE